ncbi:hypothetical protein Afe04nite_22560 [Asanoa ferruginea]|nr:hypothetical protein Afe04nite_22560 [Asanoa ferruginea]
MAARARASSKVSDTPTGYGLTAGAPDVPRSAGSVELGEGSAELLGRQHDAVRQPAEHRTRGA